MFVREPCPADPSCGFNGAANWVAFAVAGRDCPCELPERPLSNGIFCQKCCCCGVELLPAVGLLAVLGAGLLAPPENRCHSEGFGGCAVTGSALVCWVAKSPL